jgi:predicted RNA-binding Zn-ribbon protein involved in translation (DUF1610 family)
VSSPGLTPSFRDASRSLLLYPLPVDTPVVIAAFRSHAEAVRARDALEDEGIGARTSVRTDGIERRCAEAFEGGFDVIVDDQNADRSIALLQRIWPDETPLAAETRCPACGSGDIWYVPRVRLLLLAAAVLFVTGIVTDERDLFLLMIAIVAILLLFTPAARCRSCGEHWRGRRAPPSSEEIFVDVACPRCGSLATERIDRRREKATTLIVNMLVPPMWLFWPLKPRHRCGDCGHLWR